MEDNKYIERLIQRLEFVDDVELVYLVNKLIEERNELLDNINVDQLTGAYNRRILNSITDFSAVVMCDIDDFKKINDTYGHDTGDLALRIVAKELFANSRVYDYVIRFGGDEFLIIFSNCSTEIIYKRMEKIREDLTYPFRDMGLNITLSVGIAEREEEQSLAETITNADIALYKSKNNGKNTITIFDEKELTLKK